MGQWAWVLGSQFVPTSPKKKNQKVRRNWQVKSYIFIFRLVAESWKPKAKNQKKLKCQKVQRQIFIFKADSWNFIIWLLIHGPYTVHICRNCTTHRTEFVWGRAQFASSPRFWIQLGGHWDRDAKFGSRNMGRQIEKIGKQAPQPFSRPRRSTLRCYFLSSDVNTSHCVSNKAPRSHKFQNLRVSASCYANTRETQIINAPKIGKFSNFEFLPTNYEFRRSCETVKSFENG